MKKLIAAFLFGILAMTSCSKDDNSTEPSPSIYDNSNYGIYKGVFTGSSGNILINIQENGTATAILNIDGTAYTFACAEPIVKDADSQILFTNEIGSFVFSVKSDGSLPSFNAISIDGHPEAGLTVMKETSGQTVSCYEGKAYVDSVEGATFNFVITNDEVKGLVKSHSDIPRGLTGTKVGNTIDCMINDGVRFMGTVSGAAASGTWEDINPASDEFGLQGTWSATKKL